MLTIPPFLCPSPPQSDGCEKFYYMNLDGGCALCQDGTKCDSVGNELGSLWVKAGYFRTVPSSSEVYPCILEKAACLGGNSTGNNLCREGYEAMLCSSCSARYFFDSLTRTCRDCEATHVTPAMVVISVVILVVGCALIFMRDKVMAWSEKWLNMGKVRIVYTTCQVSST